MAPICVMDLNWDMASLIKFQSKRGIKFTTYFYLGFSIDHTLNLHNVSIQTILSDEVTGRVNKVCQNLVICSRDNPLRKNKAPSFLAINLNRLHKQLSLQIWATKHRRKDISLV